jgi:peptidoglycan hydrolase-like protein with peptidoglycan-binding domain
VADWIHSLGGNVDKRSVLQDAQLMENYELAVDLGKLTGVWETYYKLNLNGMDNDRLGFAIRTVKEELVYNGYDKPEIKLDLAIFGNYAVSNTKDFQKANGLEVDGVIGPKSLLVLSRKRATELENQYRIPDHRLARQKTGESANDPNAVGPDNDTGPLQIVPKYHPGMTLKEMVSLKDSLTYGAQQMKAAYNDIGDWDGAMVAWNIGWTRARAWVQAGKPATGGTVITINGKQVTVYEQATKYRNYILGCSY